MVSSAAEMGTTRRIAILLHEKDRYPKENGHFIWWLCDVWRSWGIEIEVLHGTARHVDADLLIPHVDTTVVPQEYMDFFEKYPRVVNRGLRDISKRNVSRNLVARGDSYDGPVIVKTNWNCGGITDLAFPERRVVLSFSEKESSWKNLFRGGRTSSDWTQVNSIRAGDYPIFWSLRQVPDEIFENKSLVVERFLPEHDGETYCLRYLLCFGDQRFCTLLRSFHPVVKHRYIMSREEFAIPEEMETIRRELSLDYGKIDFVIREGRVVLLDVNRTTGVLASVPEREGYAQRLAVGVHSFF